MYSTGDGHLENIPTAYVEGRRMIGVKLFGSTFHFDDNLL